MAKLESNVLFSTVRVGTPEATCADIERSACAETSAASAGSVATFYFESLDVDASSVNTPVPETVLLSKVSKMDALPTANNREFPVPVHCSVAPFPWMVISVKMIGVAVSPNGLCASRSQKVVEGVHRLFQHDREWPAIAL